MTFSSANTMVWSPPRLPLTNIVLWAGRVSAIFRVHRSGGNQHSHPVSGRIFVKEVAPRAFQTPIGVSKLTFVAGENRPVIALATHPSSLSVSQYGRTRPSTTLGSSAPFSGYSFADNYLATSFSAEASGMSASGRSARRCVPANDVCDIGSLGGSRSPGNWSPCVADDAASRNAPEGLSECPWNLIRTLRDQADWMPQPSLRSRAVFRYISVRALPLPKFARILCPSAAPRTGGIRSFCGT